MKRTMALMAMLIPLLARTAAAPPATASGATASRVLIIEPSVMPVAGGKATLTIGVLQPAERGYTGDYKISVSPYFYKSEKGRLNIVVSDEAMTKFSDGKAAAITGTATTSGKGGATRHIDATATPASIDRGTLKLWFMSGDRKMTFEPAYHFTKKPVPAPPLLAGTSNLTQTKLRAPVSHRAVEASKRP